MSSKTIGAILFLAEVAGISWLCVGQSWPFTILAWLWFLTVVGVGSNIKRQSDRISAIEKDLQGAYNAWEWKPTAQNNDGAEVRH